MKKTSKFLSKVFCFGLATLTCLTGVGCGAQEEVVPEGATVIYVDMWDSGFGTDWMKEIINNYNAKEKGIFVKLDSTALRDKALLPAVAKTDYDVMIMDNSSYYKESLVSNIKGYNSTYAEITDVVKSKYEGEDTTLEEKMIDDAKFFANINGKYYFMPLMCNYWGLTYNIDILNKYYLPRTTFEFEKLCKEMKNDKSITAPIIFSGDTDYWDPVLWTWWAQYDTKASYDAFYRAEDLTGKQTPDIFASKGRLRALQALEQVLTPSNGYADDQSTGYQYMQAQVKYLTESYGFMANGGWLDAEMKGVTGTTKTANIGLLETPIISSIVEKLSFYNETNKNGKKVDYYDLTADKMAEYDAKLCELVSYVDGVIAEKPNGVTDEDIETIQAARDIFYLDGLSFAAAIPCYSTHIDEAKDFLQYLYSNEVLKMIVSANIGAMLPLDHSFLSEEDKANFPYTIKTMINILGKKDMIYQQFNSPYVYDGGLTDFRMSGTMEVLFGSVNAADRKTPMEIFMNDYNYYHSGNAWTNLLASSSPVIG